MPEEESEPRTVTPFKVINRGEDTLDRDDHVVFADFSPRVLPSEVPDEDIDEALVPKGSPAQVPVQLQTSTTITVPPKSETPVPNLADSGSGEPNETGTGSPDSSSVQKSGQEEPPA